MDVISEERADELSQNLADIAALERNGFWQKIYLPKLNELAKHHTEQHENETLLAEKRAEHLHAMKALRELVQFVEEKRTKYIASLKRRRRAVGKV